jgi:hypothetical protein
MTARIYRPSKTAMSSGEAKTHEWVLDFEPETPRSIEPLMGYTSSGDMRQQVHLRFADKEQAVAYAERNGIPYRVIEPKDRKRRTISYSDNFNYRRTQPWSH